jgi:hypothetical protein
MRVLSSGRVKRDRVKRDEEEWREIIRRYESGGVGLKEFCKREVVASLSSLRTWRVRLGGERRARFVEVTGAVGRGETVCGNGTEKGEVELRFPGGMTLQVRC